MQPRNLFAMPEGEDTEKLGEIDLDAVVLGVVEMNIEQVNEDVTSWSRSGLDGISVDATVIDQAISMPKPNHDDLVDDDEDADDTYINDAVVPPFSVMGEE